MPDPDPSPAAEPPLRRVRVWDLPTRVFHWVLAANVIGSVVTGSIGGAALVWHFRLGYCAFTLLAFRILWGLVGGRWSRFANFVYTPGTVRRYLRGQHQPADHLEVGHNPLGSYSVLAMLALLVAQVGTGLFADDEIASVGPLNRFVSNATASLATGWHKGWGAKLIIVLVLLHVSAILYYGLRKRIDLVRPMLSGDKTLPHGVPPAADGLAHRLLAAFIALACAGGAAWVASFGG